MNFPSDSIKVGTKKKPDAAYANHDNAEENIRVKLNVIVKAVEKAAHLSLDVATEASDRKVILEQLPLSRRQFSLWTPNDLRIHFNLGDFVLSRNARITLVNSKYIISVDDAIASVKILIGTRSSAEKHADSISLYLRRASVAVSLRRIAERALINEKRLSIELRASLAASEGKLISLQRESEIAIQKLEDKIASLSAEKAALIVQLKNLVPLRAGVPN